MKGKTVVITGGTSGIGEVAAEKLAQMGARIVLVARDKSRGEGTLARLRTRAPNVAHRVHYADLTRISEMKRVATEIAEAEPRIDVLVNNAGAMFATRKLTEDGLEFTFALNHMAYFVVTQGLRERLVASDVNESWIPFEIVDAHEIVHGQEYLEVGLCSLLDRGQAGRASLARSPVAARGWRPPILNSSLAPGDGSDRSVRGQARILP